MNHPALAASNPVSCGRRRRVRRALLRRAAATAAAGLLLAAAAAQDATLPPIFKQARVNLLPARTVAELPRGTFLENLVFDREGIGYISSHLDGVVHRLGSDGRLSPMATLPGKLAGVALDAADGLVIAGSDTAGRSVLFGIDRAGRARVVATLPQAIFLNGLARLAGDVYLVADSYKGAIWRVDLGTGAASVWMQDARLARLDERNPTPGVNGIKIDGGRVWLSNTAQQSLFTVAVREDGSAGALQLRCAGLNVDDFVVNADGSLFAATHVYNSVIHIAPGCAVTVLADAGSGTVGSTAVALGRGPSDKGQLYVTTNGGLFLPPAGGVEAAKLVQLRVDVLR